MKTTLLWLAAVVSLAAIFLNPLPVAALSFITYIIGRSLVRYQTTQRYATTALVALAGTGFLKIFTSTFPTTTLFFAYVIAITVVSARSGMHHKQEDMLPATVYETDHEPEIIEAEVISATTVEHTCYDRLTV